MSNVYCSCEGGTIVDFFFYPKELYLDYDTFRSVGGFSTDVGTAPGHLKSA
jgi:hypothetical protein